MITRTVTAGEATTTARSGQRTLVVLAAALLVGIGVAWGALTMSAAPVKDAPLSLADGARYVFVPSRNTPQVAIIDGKSDRVVARIKLAGIPDQAVVSDAADALAVSFAGRNALEIVPLSGPAPHTSVALPLAPDFMVLSPDGYLIAAADGKLGSVAIVSLQKQKLLFTLSGFGDPRKLTFSLDGSQLYITDGKMIELAVVDIVQEKVVERLALDPGSVLRQSRGHRPGTAIGVSALTRTADGRLGFVSLASLDTVLVIDLTTLRLVKRLAVGRAPSRAYGTADGRLMLVPNEGDQSVSVIDAGSLEVSATLPGAKDVTAINTGWLESYAFVLSSSQKRVAVLDLMRLSRIGDIELPGFPGTGVVNSTGQKLYVALSDTGQAAVIDTRTHKLAPLIDGIGQQPWGALMARSNNYCH